MPAKSTIGGTAVQLTATSTPSAHGVLVRADTANTGTVYVGFANTVTANSADATDGFPLSAGDAIMVTPKLASDVSNIWLIASGSGQKVFWQVDEQWASFSGSGASIAAGSAILGKVGVDQTTDGTTNAVRELANLGTAQVATRLCYPTVAGSATLEKTKWPGAYTVSLPTAGGGGVANLTESAAVVGGVFSPAPHWGGVLLDFAGVGSADATMVVEIGKVAATACMPQKIASVSLKSITTSGTFTANFDPFTGQAQSSTTFRLFDLATITSRSGVGELLTALGGTEDNTPCQLVLDVTSGVYYYVLVTTLGVTGPVTICITPIA